MTVTREQAQMVATLAAACRPTGARRWDHAGIMAALAKVRDRSLPEVIMATIRAAADRDAQTPGVIPSAGSHWAEAASVRPFVPDSAPAGTRCTVCGLVAHEHGIGGRARDHDFAKVYVADPDEVAAHVAALKAELAPTSGPTIRRSLTDMADANPDLHARVEALRAANPGLTPPAMQATEETP